MPTVLEDILEKKKQKLEGQRKVFPVAELEHLLAEAPPVRDLYAQLLRQEPLVIPIIAELKRKSPSQGEIRKDLSPAQLAKAYERAGARALSVLTEEDYFGGSWGDLTEVKRSSNLPVLCKDFIISSFQVLLARIYGADVVLLIASALNKEKLSELYFLTRELLMTPLVEVHNQEELERALELGARLIGINNRNLKTLEVNLETTKSLLPLIPKDRIIISESGFKTRAELELFQKLGVKAFLIGTSLLTSENPEQKLKELVYGKS